jgi:hypothetical protein
MDEPIKMLKDGLLRVSMLMEQHAASGDPADESAGQQTIAATDGVNQTRSALGLEPTRPRGVVV